MANKGFYGGPGWPFGGDPNGGGRGGQGTGSAQGGGYAFALAGFFGNPDGATTGGGAYRKGGNNPDGPNQGGGGGPTPLTWTQRTSPTLAPINAIAVSPSGVAMLVTNTGKWSSSTDGGHTWTIANSVTIGNQAVFGLAFGSGAWITATAENPGSVRRSTDGGGTWTLIDTGTGDLGVAVGTDGAGLWVYAGQNGNWASSTDNGLTWQAFVQPNQDFIGPALVYGPPLFTVGGAPNFVVLGDFSGNPGIFHTPDQFPPSGNSFADNLPGGLAFGNGKILLGIPGGVRNGLTLIDILLGSDILIPVLGNNVSVCLAGNGLYFAFDGIAGDVANSTDGNTWVAGTVPFFGTAAGAYDSTHQSFIVGSQFGDVGTFP